MCGILGVVSNSQQQIDLSVFQNSLSSISHRGPDGFGISQFDSALIGMRRLAIMDVDTGKQPAKSISGRHIVVFNGEIYNYKDLRSSNLEIPNSQFSEAELIANLYEKEGLEFISRLEGFFAIAIYDSKTNDLVLIRDRFGKKPLYFGFHGNNFYFSSEIKALLNLGFPRDPDLSSVIDVLKYGHPVIPRTGYSGISQVPPGNYLVLSKNEISVKEYWRLLKHELYSEISESEAKLLFKEKLLKSVEKRIVAERPLGVFLSGGIDSTLVLCALRELGLSNIETFTVGFSHSDYDESHHAKAISEFIGTNHHELILEPDPSFFVDTYPRFMDIPYADSSFMPTFMLSQFATNHIKVALSGDGGDESFGGYERYRVNLKIDTLVNFVPRALLPKLMLKDRLQNKFYRAIKQHNFGDRYDSMLRLFSDDFLADAIFGTILNFAQSDMSPAHKQIRESTKSLADMQRYDVDQYLPSDLLVKMDMASMANGLEVRSPFLDPELFTFGYSISEKLKVRNGQGKFLAREVLSGFLPRNLFERPKQGFAIPRAEWLRGPLRPVVQDVLFGSKAKSRGWFSQEFLARIVNKHDQGWDLDELIWPVLMIEIWARKWIDA